MNNLIREDYILGNKKIVVGDNLHDLVLENLGKIWIRYGNSYKDFQSFITTVAKSTKDFSRVVIEPTGAKDPSSYKSGMLVFDVLKKILYLKYEDELLLLLEYNDKLSEKYVNKTGDKMTGPLEIDYDGVPLKIKSKELVKNLNVEYLQGKTPNDFAQKDKDEIINGNWRFKGSNVHDGHNDFNNSVDINGELKVKSEATFSGQTHFQNKTDFNKTATFKDSNIAIRVGTGDIVTDGSIGSSQFMSGMTGYGWKLDAQTNTLTIDNLIVRGILNVFELVVNKISATNGSFWVTDSFKVDTIYDIIYLNEDDYDSVVQTEEFINNLFDKNKYYIPVTNNQNLNPYISSTTPDTSTHPYATRDDQSPEGQTTPSFDFCKWIFKILQIDEFKKKFTQTIEEIDTDSTETVILSDYLDELDSKGISNYIDESSYIRVYNIISKDERLDDLDYLPMIGEEEPDPETNLYLKIEDGILMTTVDTENALKSDDLNTEIVVTRHTHTSVVVNPEYSVSDLFTESILKTLATLEIIQIYHIFQKTPTSVNGLEQILTSSFYIYPEDINGFTNQLFTIVNSKTATLNEDGYYIFKASDISNINLYYKYFGSNLTNGMNLYVLESKQGEYPVFKPGDILKCQKFTGTSVKQYYGLVLGLIDAYGFVIQLQNKSLLSENVVYSYTTDGELIKTEIKVDDTLYNKSEGLEAIFDNYLNLAEILLRKYADESPEGRTEMLDQVQWSIHVLIPENEYQTYYNALISAQTEEAILAQVELIIENGVSGLTFEEIKNHPIFKKALLQTTQGIPEKDDSIVRIGSIYPGDRRNSMYLTSSESNSPYQDVLIDINRPDYTVNYLTPKYQTFEGSFIYDGNQRKGKFYIQKPKFMYIMYIGDQLKDLNKTWTATNFSSLPSSVAKQNLITEYTTITDNIMLQLKAIYDQYRPYSMLGNDNSQEGYYTINPEHLTYDSNGNIIINNGLYFTTNESKLITGEQLSDNNSFSYQDEGSSIQIKIGARV